MVKAAAGIGMAHVPLGVPGENIAEVSVLGRPTWIPVPNEILVGSQVDFVELLHAFAPEQRVSQFTRAILAAKDEGERSVSDFSDLAKRHREYAGRH